MLLQLLLLRQSRDRKGANDVEPSGNFKSKRKQLLGPTLLERLRRRKWEMKVVNIIVQNCQIIHVLRSKSIREETLLANGKWKMSNGTSCTSHVACPTSMWNAKSSNILCPYHLEQ